MAFQEMGDAAILRELGDRLRRERLEQNLTQADLAKRTGVSRRTIQKTEEGRGGDARDADRSATGAGAAGPVGVAVAGAAISPVQLLKLRGKVRKRASGAGRKSNSNPASQVREGSQWQWGE